MLAALLGQLTACSPEPDAPSPALPERHARTATSRHAHITVALIVDQLSLWEAIERVPKLPPGGGLSRLLREADVAAELRYGYVETSTAIGHAALFTGLSPHETRVTSNEVLTPDGADVPIVRDANEHLVDERGQSTRPGTSLAALPDDRETFADALRRQRPDVTLACVSMKDRGAVFACGRHPDAVLWFDATSDAFVTSTAFASAFPPLGVGFGTPGIGASQRRDAWTPLDPAWLMRVSGPAAPRTEEGDFEGLGRAFPHAFEGLTHPAKAMLATPMADTLLMDLALSVLRRLPTGHDAYLAISLSAHDYVSHVFTPGSKEAWDELLRLDRQLARLYDALDAQYGAAGYGIVLSADHGAPGARDAASDARCKAASPDRFERACSPPVRLLVGDLSKRAEKIAERTLGKGHWILGTTEPILRFTDDVGHAKAEDRARLVLAEIAELGAVPGIARVVDTQTAKDACPGYDDDSMDALLCRSLPPHGPSGLLIVPEPGAFFETGYVPGEGCNHGTPYLFDRTVPFLVRRPGVARLHALPDPFSKQSRVDSRAYSRALAELMGIDPPGG